MKIAFCFGELLDVVDYGDESDESPVILQLMSEYAAKDKNYSGIEVVTPFKPGDKTCRVRPPPVDTGPPRPVLYVRHDGTYVVL